MSAPAAVGSAFAEVLRGERELFNQKFVEARHARPELDAQAFIDFLRGPVATVVEPAAERGDARAVAHAAYDAALTLIGEKLAGPCGRHAEIDRMWTRLLPAIPHLVANEPARVIGSLTNAVFHLARTPGARADQFVALLLTAAPSLGSVTELLAAGHVAAWRAGLAHFRDGALASAETLPAVAPILLGAPTRDWPAIRARLASERWWDPSAPDEPALPRIAASVGGFRGFGGSFARPPEVFAVDGQLFVAASGECWQLCADAFGATLHRADPGLRSRSVPHPALHVAEHGVALSGGWLPLPAIGAVTSAAAVPRTIAVTGALTHSVTLVAVAT